MISKWKLLSLFICIQELFAIGNYCYAMEGMNKKTVKFNSFMVNHQDFANDMLNKNNMLDKNTNSETPPPVAVNFNNYNYQTDMIPQRQNNIITDTGNDIGINNNKNIIINDNNNNNIKDVGRGNRTFVGQRIRNNNSINNQNNNMRSNYPHFVSQPRQNEIIDDTGNDIGINNKNNIKDVRPDNRTVMGQRMQNNNSINNQNNNMRMGNNNMRYGSTPQTWGPKKQNNLSSFNVIKESIVSEDLMRAYEEADDDEIEYNTTTSNTINNYNKRQGELDYSIADATPISSHTINSNNTNNKTQNDADNENYNLFQ